MYKRLLKKRIFFTVESSGVTGEMTVFFHYFRLRFCTTLLRRALPDRADVPSTSFSRNSHHFNVSVQQFGIMRCEQVSQVILHLYWWC